MGFARRPHQGNAIAAWCAAALMLAATTARAQGPGPGAGTPTGPSGRDGRDGRDGREGRDGRDASASAPAATPEVPAWAPPPARFAVAPFENRSGVRAFDWLVAGAPFEISQKSEAVLGLEPTGGALHVAGAAVAAEPAGVAALAAARGARYVITGWVERPNWQLRIGVTLWAISPGSAASGAAAGPAVVVAEAQRTGEVKAYHQLLGELLGEVWRAGGGLAIGAAQKPRLARPLATDLYAVTLLGRGLGHLTGALGAVDLKAAEHDLERAVFIDPKCFEAQRLLGELYLLAAPGDVKAAARALGKFNYANDLAPDDIATLRAAARGAAQAGKHVAALELLRALVARRPWDLDARYELGAALWRTGDPAGAERQLEQVTQRRPDLLQARRVLVLIHAARSDTRKLIGELEAIAARAPDDLEVKADLATAYGSTGQWDRAIAALETIAAARPGDLALHVRVGDAHRRQRDVEGALAWYARAAKIAPDSSWPGFAAAQALFDAGRLPEAERAYLALLRFRDDAAAAEQALGVVALAQRRPDEAVARLRRAAGEARRSVATWRALIVAELARRDPAAAQRDVEAALPTWPTDGPLRYLAGVAYAQEDDVAEARRAFEQAAQGSDAAAARAARTAIGVLDAGGRVALDYAPELARPWGDADALAASLARYAALADAQADARERYQRGVLEVLGALRRGPGALRRAPATRCPVARVAPAWAAAQRDLAEVARLGALLEQDWKFIARHDDAGATASLLPNARAQVASARRSFRIALADLGELRAEWTRALGPELRAAGCGDRLLAAAVAEPGRYRLGEAEAPDPVPPPQPPRPRGRATFYIDNTRCLDPVEVWVDGAQLGQVAPGRRSALVADAGERALCLLVPGAAQCGDRGTLRQVYLHDGWSVTMHCLK